MKVTKETLKSAVEKQIISSEQADLLLDYLKSSPDARPAFDLTHVLYYSGGLIAIGAMTLFMNLGWESFGGWGISAISIVYAIIGILLAEKFKAKGYHVPAGISATFVVTLTPLFIYGIQRALGLWPGDDTYRDYHRYIKALWIYMELGTIAVGALVAWKYKYPFLIMPIAFTLWYMTMDMAAVLSGGDLTWAMREKVSIYGGLFIIAVALFFDLKRRNGADYSFWLYLFGVMAFWGGLGVNFSDSELDRFYFFLINLLMIGLSLILNRRVFVIFGTLGCCGYLGHLAYKVFPKSWLFPISLTIIGFITIYLGILWQKHEKELTNKIRRYLPKGLKALVKDT